MQPIGLAQWHEGTIREAAMKAVMLFLGKVTDLVILRIPRDCPSPE
jgi:hypothetical protein